MVQYKVTLLEDQKTFLVEGNFNPGAIPINIPEDDPDRQKYIDYCLHETDIDEAFTFLRCISNDKPDTINKALFIAGLNSAMKIFKPSRARKEAKKIVKDEILKQFPELESDLNYFESLRDKHYIHDENSMIEATAFMLLNPEDSSGKVVESPIVFKNTKSLNYYEESLRLQRLLHNVGDYILERLDGIGAQIEERYAEIERDVLESYGSPSIKLASTQKIDKTRG